MKTYRLTLIALVAAIALIFPDLTVSYAAPVVQTSDELSERVATLETAVADLVDQNEALAARIAELEAALTVTSMPTISATETVTESQGLLPTPTPQADASDEESGPSAARVANIRGGPGTDYAVIDSVTTGDPIAVVGRTEDGTWYEIELAGENTGWIAAFLVDDTPPLADIPVAAEIPPVPAPQADEEKPEEAEETTTATGAAIGVDFINPHYNCTRGHDSNDFYRYFQIDLFIDNTSGETIEAPWKPSRWFITDGVNERVDDVMLQWCSRVSGCYEQPDILPGGSEGWTWVNERAELHEWVKAVEFDYGGRTYRQEFENNARNRADWNYGACRQ